MRTAQAGDVSGTVDNVVHMSKMIQIRNVPDEMHRLLKMRAAAEGISLSDLIKRELGMIVGNMLTWDEVDARITARGPSKMKSETIVQIIRESARRLIASSTLRRWSSTWPGGEHAEAAARRIGGTASWLWAPHLVDAEVGTRAAARCAAGEDQRRSGRRGAGRTQRTCG